MNNAASFITVLLLAITSAVCLLNLPDPVTALLHASLVNMALLISTVALLLVPQPRAASDRSERLARKMAWLAWFIAVVSQLLATLGFVSGGFAPEDSRLDFYLLPILALWPSGKLVAAATLVTVVGRFFRGRKSVRPVAPCP